MKCPLESRNQIVDFLIEFYDWQLELFLQVVFDFKLKLL